MVLRNRTPRIVILPPGTPRQFAKKKECLAEPVIHINSITSSFVNILLFLYCFYLLITSGRFSPWSTKFREDTSIRHPFGNPLSVYLICDLAGGKHLLDFCWAKVKLNPNHICTRRCCSVGVGEAILDVLGWAKCVFFLRDWSVYSRGGALATGVASVPPAEGYLLWIGEIISLALVRCSCREWC